MKEKLTALQIAVFAVNCTNSEEDIENVRKAIEEYRSQQQNQPQPEKAQEEQSELWKELFDTANDMVHPIQYALNYFTITRKHHD